MKRPYMWLGIAADYDQEVLDAYAPPVPFLPDSEPDPVQGELG